MKVQKGDSWDLPFSHSRGWDIAQLNGASTGKSSKNGWIKSSKPRG
jgi:hypothetical protein